MAIERYDQIGFGDELPEHTPDVGMSTVREFVDAAHMPAVRFTDHEKARAEGMPGAIVPGIMSQGILAAVIHRWAPDAEIEKLDTIFRAPLLVDSKPRCRAVVTDMDDEARVVEIDLTIVNEADETRVLGTARVRFPR